MLTKEQAAIISACTGTLMLEPRYFIQEIEKKLGRKVLPVEFTPSFQEELKTLFMDDFIELCWEPPHGGIILPTT